VQSEVKGESGRVLNMRGCFCVDVDCVLHCDLVSIMLDGR
jgi:hypothetical protein